MLSHQMIRNRVGLLDPAPARHGQKLRLNTPSATPMMRKSPKIKWDEP